MRKNIILTALTTSSLVFSGCHCDSKERMSKEEIIKGESYLLNSDDFDLKTVIGLIKGDGISNIEELEKKINSPDTGINNVDLDGDGKIDYVLVKENRDGSNFTLEFLAVPSKTKKEDEANLVASMKIKQTGESVEVSGGYPNYVMGHDSHHYHYGQPGLSMGEALFLAWMISPRPMYMSPRPYMGAGYAPRSYMTPSQRSTVRSSYTKTNTKVAPVKKSAKPANYKPAPSASKTKSKFSSGKLKPNPNDKKLSSRNKSAKEYKKHKGSKSKGSSFFGGSKSKSKSNSSKSRGSWGRSGGSRSRGGFSCLPKSNRKVISL